MERQLEELFAFADSYQPTEYQLPLKLQPFVPDYVRCWPAPRRGHTIAGALPHSWWCPLSCPGSNILLRLRTSTAFPLCTIPVLQVPAIGAPHAFTAPPRPDGEPDFLGLTVLDEPALQQSDPASLALQLRQQLRLQQGEGSSSGRDSNRGSAPPLGWVADPARQPHKLDAWIAQVEGLHQVG